MKWRDSPTRIYRLAIVLSLILSVPLLPGICLLAVGASQGLELAASFPVQVAAAIGCMLGFGWWAGAWRGPICTRRPSLAGLFAVAVFLVGVLSGSTTSMVLYRDYSPEAWIIRPLVYLGIAGFVPAFSIGLAGCFMARRLLRVNAAATTPVR